MFTYRIIELGSDTTTPTTTPLQPRNWRFTKMETRQVFFSYACKSKIFYRVICPYLKSNSCLLRQSFQKLDWTISCNACKQNDRKPKESTLLHSHVQQTEHSTAFNYLTDWGLYCTQLFNWLSTLLHSSIQLTEHYYIHLFNWLSTLLHSTTQLTEHSTALIYSTDWALYYTQLFNRLSTLLHSTITLT